MTRGGTDPAFRARLLVAALCSLGVPANTAHDLMEQSIDLDPFAGVERGLLAVLRRAPTDEHARAMAEARALIDELSVRVDVLEQYIRSQEREAVLPLRPRGR